MSNGESGYLTNSGPSSHGDELLQGIGQESLSQRTRENIEFIKNIVAKRRLLKTETDVPKSIGDRKVRALAANERAALVVAGQDPLGWTVVRSKYYWFNKEAQKIYRILKPYCRGYYVNYGDSKMSRTLVLQGGQWNTELIEAVLGEGLLVETYADLESMTCSFSPAIVAALGGLTKRFNSRKR